MDITIMGRVAAEALRIAEDLRRRQEMLGIPGDWIQRNSAALECLNFRGGFSSEILRELCSRPDLSRFEEELRLNKAAEYSGAIDLAIKKMREFEAWGERSYSAQVELLKSYEPALERLAQSQAALCGLLPNANWLEAYASTIKTPWIDAADGSRSIEALACLHAAGKALTLPPYESLEKSAVRALFGDWKGKIPGAVYADWEARQDFYRRMGFDDRLTTLPEPAFTQSLIGTGIIREEPFPSLFRRLIPQPQDEDENEGDRTPPDAIRPRMCRAYEILYTFEDHVRDCLSNAMNRKCGPQWEKQRIPESMLKEWRRKRREAIDKGEPKRELIYYADFTDYEQIIRRKDNWREVFSSAFRDPDDATVSFRRLYPIRLCTMHARPITKDDLLWLLMESQRILKALSGWEKA